MAFLLKVMTFGKFLAFSSQKEVLGEAQKSGARDAKERKRDQKASFPQIQQVFVVFLQVKGANCLTNFTPCENRTQ